MPVPGQEAGEDGWAAPGQWVSKYRWAAWSCRLPSGRAQVLELSCEPAKRAPEVGCKHWLKEYSVLWLRVKPLGVLCKNWWANIAGWTVIKDRGRALLGTRSNRRLEPRDSDLWSCWFYLIGNFFSLFLCCFRDLTKEWISKPDFPK